MHHSRLKLHLNRFLFEVLSQSAMLRIRRFHFFFFFKALLLGDIVGHYRANVQEKPGEAVKRWEMCLVFLDFVCLYPRGAETSI